MKKFFTVVLGSFVGAWLAMIVSSVMSIVLSFMMFGMMSNVSSGKTSISDNSILVVDLSDAISDRGSDDDIMAMMMGNDIKSTALSKAIAAIKAAKTNKNIKGMYIACKGGANGVSSLYELRKAIVDFKESKKFVYAYGYEGIAQGDYFVASAADSIFVNPEASVDIHGLASMNLFFKNMLDKLGVEMQVIRVGTFKSAVEPFMLSEISEANRMQQEHYLGSIWNSMVELMAESRHMTVAEMNMLADSMLVAKDVDYLLKHKVVDGVCYKPEMEKKLKALTCGKDGDLSLVSIADMPVKDKLKGNKEIAVVFAEGEIDGSKDEGIISEELVETIMDLADEDDVAAMVLRVNSPGGSAFGSEQIWKAVEEFKASGKKVVVSMGDYAASGGYYISCGADCIFVQPTTLTGSIGIFGMVPCIENLATDKLGITQNLVATNANGGFGSVFTRMTDQQRDAMQAMVNRGYDLFTRRCAEGRGVPQDSIKAIAEGRVWDGTSALKLGLVDKIGGLDDAISTAAELAECTGNYKVEEYPEMKTRWERMLEKYAMARYEAKMRSEFGDIVDYHKIAKQVLGRDHVLCIMEPMDIR
ncbi:MAG: signal peptide peptidase SppA [Muribaculaceae bacterium]